MRGRVGLAWFLLLLCGGMAAAAYYTTYVVEQMMAADQFASAARWAHLVDWWIFPAALFLWVIAGLLTPEGGREARLPFLGHVAAFGACLLIFATPTVIHRVSRSVACSDAQAEAVAQAEDLVRGAVAARSACDESAAWARCLESLALGPDNPLAKELLLNAPTLEQLLAQQKAGVSGGDRFEQVKLAMWCREQGDDALAKREVQAFLAANPDDPSALRLLGPGTDRPQKPAARSIPLQRALPLPEGVEVPPGMVYVPGAVYPIRESKEEIQAGAFLMDRFEVTNADYAKFLDVVGRNGGAEALRAPGDAEFRHPRQPESKDHTPAYWSDPIFNAAELPVVGVDWFDAYAYAKWAGKRLPTEVEWEAAARGAEGRIFPWGDRWERGACNTPDRFLFYELWGWAVVDWPVWVSSGAARDAFVKLDATAPCAAFAPDLSPTGCADMAGNVEEWVADWFETDTGSPLASRSEGTICGIRGGSWVYGGIERPLYYRTGDSPLVRTPYRGFRCAK